MRKLIYGLGIVFAVLIALVVVLVGYTAYVGSGIDKEGKQYADDAIISVTSHWDVHELTKRATPELLKTAKPEDLDSLFQWFATLGPLVDYQGSRQTGWNQMTSISSGTVTVAQYAGTGKYQGGDAVIEIAIVKSDGVWRVNAFHVNSSKLIENKVGHGT
jgi:Na+-transporting methylmalonyl-CoA/oxaloacetate decarboxylase gamma subunit